MKLLSGNSNQPLVEAIARYLELPVTQASSERAAKAAEAPATESIVTG